MDTSALIVIISAVGMMVVITTIQMRKKRDR